jgi:hypothetical protein
VTTACSSSASAPAPTVSQTTSSSLDLTWSAVADLSVTQLEAFCVVKGDGCDVTKTVGSALSISSSIGTTTSHTVSGLQASTQYDCYVKLTNPCGSSCSAETSAQTAQTASCSPPLAPTSVTATPVTTSTGDMTVSWDFVASRTWTVGCVDNSGGSATCAGALSGTVTGLSCSGGPTCSTTVSGLTDNIAYICCVTATDTGTGCPSVAAPSGSVTTCTTPSAPTISSVVASSPGALTVSWGSVSNAASYDYFCAAGTSQLCTATAPAGAVQTPTPPVSSLSGVVSNLGPGSYTCFAKSTNTCGTACSSGVAGVVCSITPPATVTVTGSTDASLTLSWSAVSAAAQYKAFCVLRTPQGTGTATQTCADNAVGGVVTVTAPTTTATITGLTANTQYACFVKAVDSSSCESSCSAGTEYLTSQTGTSSMLVAQSSLTTLVFDDGADPNNPTLPPDEVPVLAVDESTCTNSNEFPDQKDPNAGRKALQIILNVEGYDKPGFEGSFDIQAKFYKALSALSVSVGTGPVCMRIFNVDNSRHGAGVKTRMWFDSQQNCIDFAKYVRDRWGPKGTRQNSMGTPNTFGDINHLTNTQFSTADFGLSTYTYTGEGGVTIRMITNPQSKCHKWKFPTSSVCSAQLTYYTPGATTKPGASSLTRNSDSGECSNEEDPVDIPAGVSANNNAAFQVVFSLSARRKLSGTSTTGYDQDDAFAKNVVLAFKSYFTSQRLSPKLMEIKNVDNSAAGVGLHLRIYVDSNSKGGCETMAAAMYANAPDLTDAEADAREKWLYVNVFGPYETAVNGPGPGYFGVVTRRASMQDCRNVGNNLPTSSTGVQVGQKGWVGDPMSVA